MSTENTLIPFSLAFVSSNLEKVFYFYKRVNLSVATPQITAQFFWKKVMPWLISGTTFLICSLLFWRFTLWNGYPVLAPWDSMGYIDGALSENSFNIRFRAAGYGIFLVLTSLNWSLLLSSFVQSAVISGMALLFLRCVTNSKNYLKEIGIFLFLTFFTRISFLVASFQPDVFTGLIFLSQFIFTQSQKKSEVIIAGICASVLLFMHSSFFAISVIFCLLFCTFCRVKKVKVFWLAGMHIVLGVVMLGNQLKPTNNGFIAPAFHYFVVGRMAEMYLLDEYLTDVCPKKHYAICAHQSSARGMDQTSFVWGTHPWNPDAEHKNQKELMAIVQDIILTHPFSFVRFVGQNLWLFGREWLFTVPGTSTGVGPQDITTLKQYYPNDVSLFRKSKEAYGELAMATKMVVPIWSEYAGKMIIGFGLLCLYVASHLKLANLNDRKRKAIIGLFLITFVNAFVCANGSGIFSRYFDRVHWLIFLVFAVCAGDVYRLLKLDRLMSFLHLTNTQKTTRRSVL